MKVSQMMEIGDMIPKWLPHYYSDYEYVVRAHRKGYRIVCPEDLCLSMNEKTTGLHHSDSLTIRAYFKKAFSIRSAINPWTAIKFIWVACPWYLRFFAWFRVTLFFSKSVVKASFNGF